MQKNTQNIVLIILVSFFLFVPFLGGVHLFDWDEINFAEAAREMLVSGNFNRVTINYQPFFEKPPLFFWLQAVSMKIFGVNEFAARFPNALVGSITWLVLYLTGKKIHSQKMGLLWVLCYAGSFLPQLFFRAGIIDPVFNLFMFLSVTQLFYYSEMRTTISRQKNKHLIASGLFMGLAIMTKGPVGVLLPLITAIVFYFLNLKRIKLHVNHVLILFISILFIPTLYFGIETLLHGPDYIQNFIQRNIELFSQADAGFSGPFYYHVVVILLGVFPASFLALAAFKIKIQKQSVRNYSQTMIILLLVVLLIFSIVKTKIVHYSSLAYFPVTYFAALFLVQKSKNALWVKRSWQLLFTAALVVSVLLTVFPWMLRYPLFWIDHLKDPFARIAILDNERWPWHTLLPGFCFLILLGILALFKRMKYKTRLVSLLAGSTIIIQLCIYLWIPRIEKITQASMIEFSEQLTNKEAYIITGFKSYAPYFYGKTRPEFSYKATDIDNILKGNSHETVYVITKSTHLNKYIDLYGMQIIDSKKGYFLLTIP